MTVCPALTAIEISVLHQIQKDMPLVLRPFAEWGKPLNLEEVSFLEILENLIDRKLIFRVGPRFDPMAFGGSDALMALKVSDSEMARVTEVIRRTDEIAHAHLREHAHNIWCVLMTERPEDLEKAVAQVSLKTGLEPLVLPMLTNYHGKQNRDSSKWIPDEVDRRIILATQAGLPLVPHPFQTVGQWVGIDAREIIERLKHLHAVGAIRQITGVLHRYNLGQHNSALCAWKVPLADLPEVGPILARKSYLVRTSQRPAQGKRWPYTLYASIYGNSMEQVKARIEDLEKNELGAYDSGLTMFTKDVLKKRGLRFTLPLGTH